MDTYSIQRRIVKSALSSNARLVGPVLAMHHNRVTNSTRVKWDTLLEETGISRASIARALAELVDGGFYQAKRTGRATIYVPLMPPQEPGKDSGIVDVRCVRHQKSQGETSGTTKSPFDRDSPYSTRSEEEYKRPLVQNG